jgi:hypothetical protein
LFDSAVAAPNCFGVPTTVLNALVPTPLVMNLVGRLVPAFSMRTAPGPLSTSK